MVPLIRPGDRVKVARTVPGEVRFGDIVVFRRSEDLIVHRILKMRRTPKGIYFGEKGDAGYKFSLINGANILGRVIGLKRGTRTFDFTLLPARIARLFISAWFRIAAAGINRLKPSKSKRIIMAEKVFREMSGIVSRLLVAIYLVICYLAGFFSNDRSLLNRDEDEQTKGIA
jgi:hypothetical protein